MNEKNRWRGAMPAILLAISIGFLDAPFVHAGDRQALRADQVQAGTLLLATPFGSRTATRINTRVDIAVSGLVARTRISQAFRNDGGSRVEGIYVFPLPDDAAVDRLRIRIGERYVEGEIREKAQARKAYEEARSAGKRSGLIEQQRANLFTTSIANLPAGDTITVEIEYLEIVSFESGLFSLRVPLTLTPRYIPGEPLSDGAIADREGSGWSADTDRVPDASTVTPPVSVHSDGHRVTLNADIEAGVPLERVASRYHPVAVKELDAIRGRYAVTLSSTQVPMDHDIELTWRPVPDISARAALFSETVEGTPYYLLMVLPPDEPVVGREPVPRDLVLVIDTSGSMHGTSIEQARRSLLLALDGLRPVDRFNIVQFNSTTSALFTDSVAASSANLALAARYVAALAANGGTEMRPALEQVLRARHAESHLRQIVFVTDGSVGNEAELIRLIESELGEARLFTVGIGSAPNGWFMRKAAEAGRGSYTYVSALHEAGEKMQRLVRKLELPQVTDIRVDWPSGNEVLPYPATVPDLYAGEPVLIRARLRTAPRPGDALGVSGKAFSGQWGVAIPLASSRENPGIAALWARGRIEALMDAERAGADVESTRRAIVETALEHHLVSPHTSLVAVDKTPVADADSPLSKERVPNLLPYGQSAEAIFGLPATATPQALHLAIGAAALLLGGFLWLTVRRANPGSVRHAPARS